MQFETYFMFILAKYALINSVTQFVLVVIGCMLVWLQRGQTIEIKC